MDNDDILRPGDVIDARASVLRTRRKVLIAAIIAPLVASLVVFVVLHHLLSRGIAVSGAFVIGFVLTGALSFLHWLRHYRRILRTLDDIERRVAAGEVILGSEVGFSADTMARHTRT